MSDVEALGRVLYLFIVLFLITFGALMLVVIRYILLEKNLKSINSTPERLNGLPRVNEEYNASYPESNPKDTRN